MAVTERLDEYLSENDLEAVWFARPNSFAWVTGGGDNVVDRAGDVGVAAAGYDGDGVTVVTDNIEAPRLRDEELPADATVEAVQWYEDGLAEAVERASPTPAAADFDVPGFESVDASALRQPLTDEQIEQYRSLSEDVAAAVESVARGCSADDTEREVAAELRRAIEAEGAGTPVVLVGSGERAQRYRHYTPTDVELGDYALLSVTADRDGLFASTTRTVAFDAPEWLAERTRDAMRVEATALAATREVGNEGGTAGDVFEAIQDAYADLGWEGEWRNHHQGGAAGFAGREWIATPDHGAPVELPMAYSWNPTVQGAKSEDLHLVTGDDVEPVTATGEWPTREVSAIGYDLTLERHAVLSR
ncbi:M24 family metallopeptidase [Halomicrobium urmianum]|uniref:M24 family metallopeptidase n=1 Tax=Halomicrobium urmianum TaxID=1586233 RepID=UPI001CD9A887|nr:M24 family metallopeptidase [Halomicrobium urmianum]